MAKRATIITTERATNETTKAMASETTKDTTRASRIMDMWCPTPLHLLRATKVPKKGFIKVAIEAYHLRHRHTSQGILLRHLLLARIRMARARMASILTTKAGTAKASTLTTPEICHRLLHSSPKVLRREATTMIEGLRRAAITKTEVLQRAAIFNLLHHRKKEPTTTRVATGKTCTREVVKDARKSTKATNSTKEKSSTAKAAMEKVVAKRVAMKRVAMEKTKVKATSE